MPTTRVKFLAAAHDLFGTYLHADAVLACDTLLAQLTTNPRQLKPPEPVPLRLPAVEALIIGARLTPDLLEEAGARAVDTATGLPQTTYKRALLAATVTEVLERATQAA